MTLINCPVCTKKVSKKAASCPDCGHPISKKITAKRAGAKWEGAGFLIILAGIITGIAGNMMVASLIGTAGFIVFIIGRCK